MKDEQTRILTADAVGRRIRKEREARGWSQYKLAEVTGIAAGHLNRIEHGLLSVRVDVLQRICCALQMELTFPIPF